MGNLVVYGCVWLCMVDESNAAGCGNMVCRKVFELVVCILLSGAKIALATIALVLLRSIRMHATLSGRVGSP